MVKGFVFENMGNVHMVDCSATNVEVGIEAKGIGTMKLESLLLKNAKTAFVGNDVRELLMKGVHVEGPIDPEIAASMQAALASDPDLSAKSLADRFGDALKGQGIDLWTWVSRGANAAQIVALIAQLAIR